MGKRNKIEFKLMIVLLSILTTSEMTKAVPQSGSRHPSPRVIRTKYGTIRGMINTIGVDGMGDAEVFLGIPYAEPPVGDFRFMPPGTPSPWRNTRSAQHLSPVCPQRLPDIRNKNESLKHMSLGRYTKLKRLLPYLRNQSEDCLYLNIYTPAAASTRNFRYPTMVYIHGESYEWNSGNPYDGSILAVYGEVIVVTINFRLGALGFLNTNELPHQRSITNYGLMDQIAALHWLNENIAAFGGDPDSITLFGHGTGAACINFLLTFKSKPQNLIHRAILMSGSSLAPWALVPDPRKHTHQLAKSLNCSHVSMGEPLKRCLRRQSVKNILDAQVEAQEYYFAFGPSVDGVVIDTELDTNPVAYRNRLASYDVMFGVTPSDGIFSFNEEDLRGLTLDKRNQILRSFIRNTYNYHLTEILATVVNEYTNWDRPGSFPITTRDETVSLLSDALYAAPVVHLGALHSVVSKKSFFYVFDHQTRFNDFKNPSLDRVGGLHGDELSYIWGAPLVASLSFFPSNFTIQEKKIAEAMLSYWTNFARTGNPNFLHDEIMDKNDKNKFRNLEWPAYDQKHRRYMDISGRPRINDHYRAHQLSFWLKLVPELHQAGADAPEDHHHLINHNDWATYRGYVRSQPVTRIILPPDTTTETATTKRYNVSAVLQSTPGSAGEFYNGSWHSQPRLQDGFTVYSTTLSVTIAIGCSMLILNLLIFAAVYYQRGKSQIEMRKVSENGGLLAPAHSISGELGNQQPPGSHHQIVLHHGGKMQHKNVHHPSHQAHLPPPEFADHPQQKICQDTAAHLATLPRGGVRPVGPPGSTLTLSVSRAPAPPRVPQQSLVSEAQPLLHQGQQQQTTTFTLGSPGSLTKTTICENDMKNQLRV